MSIYEQVKAAGIQHDNHETDLYVKVTPESRKIVERYGFRSNVTTFRNQRPPNVGELWFDIPFAYIPEWEKRMRH